MLLLTILADGVIYASWLFIVALGLTLIFGVLKILNIAHGSFYAVGAYAAASFVAWFVSMDMAPEWSILAMLMAAVATAALLAPLTEQGLLRFFYGRDEVLLVLVTYALFLILEDVTKLVCGDQRRTMFPSRTHSSETLKSGRCFMLATMPCSSSLPFCAELASGGR